MEVPDLSVEVDDVDEAYRRTRAGGFEIVHPLNDELWDARRFCSGTCAGSSST